MKAFCRLGKGQAQISSSWQMYYAGQEISKVWLGSTFQSPFGDINLEEGPDAITLVFAGNAGLHSESSMLPHVAATNLLKKDR